MVLFLVELTSESPVQYRLLSGNTVSAKGENDNVDAMYEKNLYAVTACKYVNASSVMLH